MDLRKMAAEEFDTEASNRFGAFLQYGADITIATAMSGFSTLLWVAPGSSETGWMWDAARTVTSGFAGAWIGVALLRFHISWRRAAKTYSRTRLAIMLVLCLAGGLAATFAAVQFAHLQKVSSACERAEATKQSQITENQLCREYFAQRAASDFSIFKAIGK